MNAAEQAQLDKAIQKAVKLYNNINDVELPSKYDFGEHIKKMLDNSTYGEKSMVALVKALHISKSPLYGFARLTKIFPRPFFNILVARRGTKDPKYRLSWNHFWTLCGVSDVDDRQVLIDKCFAQSLSLLRLREKLKEGKGKVHKKKVSFQATVHTEPDEEEVIPLAPPFFVRVIRDGLHTHGELFTVTPGPLVVRVPLLRVTVQGGLVKAKKAIFKMVTANFTKSLDIINS